MKKEIKEENLPRLKPKQRNFVANIVCRPDKPTEAYYNSYDCSNMDRKSVEVEAQKMLKHPKIALWIKYYQQNAKAQLDEEIKYGKKEAFKEFEELKKIALDSCDRLGNCNINAAIKAAEETGSI